MKKILFIAVMILSFQGICQTTHSVVVAVNQGSGCPVVSGLGESDLFKVFPNPATSSFTVETSLQQSLIRLVDMNGKEVRTSELKKGTLKVDVIGLSEGIYLLYLESPSGADHIKIKIQ